MKNVFITLILCLCSLNSFAVSAPEGHWTLKNITCKSGAQPNPGMIDGYRYDLHLFANSNFEIIIARPTDWFVSRGTYSLNSVSQICFNDTENMGSQQPLAPSSGYSCRSFSMNGSKLHLSSDEIYDCAPNPHSKTDTTIIEFERM